MLQKKDIVIFDFDGTLSAGDTNREFFKYCFRHSLRPWFYLPSVIVGCVGHFLNPGGIWWREKIRKFITPKMVEDFSVSVINAHKQKRFSWAQEIIDQEKQSGNIVILISASCDYLIPLLVSDMNFDAVICSKMNKDKPWKYEFMCWGKNKVIALDNWVIKHKIIPNVIRAYSDSQTDMPIMEIAKEQVWIDSKTGARK